MKKLLFLLLSTTLGVAVADEQGESAVSGSFTVFPIQVVFNTPGKVKELTLINTGNGILNTQSKLVTYTQSLIKGTQVESNSIIAGAPAVIVTPIVISGVKPNAKQSIRMLATKQDDNIEIVYRYFIKNLVPQSVSSSGTNFEIQYGIPVFVLPKNIHESYAFSYVRQNTKAYLKIANTGNVHVMFKQLLLEVNGKSVDIGAGGRLLVNNYRYIEIPAKVDAALATSKTLKVTTYKVKTIDFEQLDPVSIEVTK